MKIKKQLLTLTFLSIFLLMSGGLIFAVATPTGNEAGDLDRDRDRDQGRTQDGDCDRDCLCDGDGDCECNCYGPSDDEGNAGPGEGDGTGISRIEWRYMSRRNPKPE